MNPAHLLLTLAWHLLKEIRFSNIFTSSSGILNFFGNVFALCNSIFIWISLSSPQIHLYTSKFRINLGSPLDSCEKTDLPVQAKLRKNENRTESLWYSLWISSRWLHCKVPEIREEIREVFSFERNRMFTAQQRGLDFALVQARHSPKVISYFATKALSTSLFWPSLEKQSVTAGDFGSILDFNQNKSRTCCQLATMVDLKAKHLEEEGRCMAQLDV